MSEKRPTEEIYQELQGAYDFFNRELFETELPPCLLTLQRKKRSRGYFMRKRFISHNGEICHEIAMNPEFFATQSVEETLSTLVHEMVHLQQFAAGDAGRGRYHNKSWGDMMESLGLMPTSTGSPGGDRVGDKVTHYIMAGGPYESAVEQLLTQDFRLSWMDRFPHQESLTRLINGTKPGPTISPPRPPESYQGGEGGAGVVSPLHLSGPGKMTQRLEALKRIGVDVTPPEPRQKNLSNREKYTCPKCQTNIWGKPGLDILCGACSSNDNLIPFNPASMFE